MSKRAWPCCSAVERDRQDFLPITSVTSLRIGASEDIVRMRTAVRQAAVAQGMSLIDQTKIVTAASELARNALDYGGGGAVAIEPLSNGLKHGVRLTFSDQGPGIANIEQ